LTSAVESSLCRTLQTQTLQQILLKGDPFMITSPVPRQHNAEGNRSETRLQRFIKMGSSQSKVAPPANTSVSTDSEGGCPVRSKKPTEEPESACPVRSSSSSQGSDAKNHYKNQNVYNVYNQKLDPTNNMPSNANQVPSDGQMLPLEKNRVASTIPKGGTDNSTWQYPSPQMFWNALVRKNKQEGASEEDIDSVVAVHNNMNESTWKQVLIWEAVQAESGSDQDENSGKEPKLLRFLGRPDDLSPRAYIKSLFGHPKPFDRHDWYVDRGGKEVRYIIDYYHDERYEGKDKKPTSMHDTTSVKSIMVEVRPAADSVEAVLTRLFKMPYYTATGNTAVKNYVEVPFLPQKDMLSAEANRRDKLSLKWAQIQSTCDKRRIALETCKGDSECAVAAINLQKCTASVVCPDVVEHFDKCVSSSKASSQSNKESVELELERAYLSLTKCLEMFEIESKAQ
jgi:cytochrome c heme-lyase